MTTVKLPTKLLTIQQFIERRRPIWILTTIGFFSIVQKERNQSNDTLTIRARVREDLEGLRAYIPDMSDIIESEDSDYRYRAVAKRETVMAALATLAGGIDYDNFKNEVASRQGYRRAVVYGDVWQVLYRLQSNRR
jgi:hypothetical protein